MIAVAASGVSRPATSSTPATNSVPPASSAMRRPGRKPIEWQKPAVPAMPCPPNQPKVFCAPWPASSAPTTRRTMSSPMSTSPPWYELSRFVEDKAVETSTIPLALRRAVAVGPGQVADQRAADVVQLLHLPRRQRVEQVGAHARHVARGQIGRAHV